MSLRYSLIILLFFLVWAAPQAGTAHAEQAAPSASVSAQTSGDTLAEELTSPVLPAVSGAETQPEQAASTAPEPVSEPASELTPAAAPEPAPVAAPVATPEPISEAAPAAAPEATPEAAPAADAQVSTAQSQALPTSSASPPVTFFSMANVEAKARAMAERPFENPEGSVPDFLLNISYDQWRKLRFRTDHSLWRNEKLPFEVQFFHPGLFYNRLVAINIVEGSEAKKLPFSTDMFEYGDESLAQRIDEVPMEYAGFRLHYPINKPNYNDEVVVFLGATYFRAVAKDSQYGLSGRGLALDTALASGEEFPYFREFWLVKPAIDAEAITVYALMDTPTMTGAYRFVITPGERTVMDTRCTLFARKDAKGAQKIGIAPLTSMFLFGETENGQKGDYRPEVHDSDGLLFCDAAGQWLWSPLANPRRLAVNAFDLPSPRGFGFMQRDAKFDHYQDLEALYDRRPSLWVEPRSDWGPGRLELIEIPSVEEIHDNMVAFWVPEKPRIEKDGTTQEGPYPSVLSFAYRLSWMAPGRDPHSLARAVATRISTPLQGDTMRFLIDFEGEDLNALPADTGLSSLIVTPPDMPVLEKQLVKNKVTGGWRLVFQVRVPKDEGVIQSLRAAREGSPAFRFRALLKKGENLPEPLTETWVYDLQK